MSIEIRRDIKPLFDRVMFTAVFYLNEVHIVAATVLLDQGLQLVFAEPQAPQHQVLNRHGKSILYQDLPGCVAGETGASLQSLGKIGLRASDGCFMLQYQGLLYLRRSWRCHRIR